MYREPVTDIHLISEKMHAYIITCSLELTLNYGRFKLYTFRFIIFISNNLALIRALFKFPIKQWGENRCYPRGACILTIVPVVKCS